MTIAFSVVAGLMLGISYETRNKRTSTAGLVAGLGIIAAVLIYNGIN